MKIAILSTFYPYRGGIAQFNAALYREFELAHDVRAFTFTRQYPDALFPGKSQYVGDDDTATDRIPAERTLDTVNPLSYYRTAAKINKFAPDLLLTKFWMPFFAPSLGKVARLVRKRGAKHISILDNVIPHERRPGDLALTRYFLRSCDASIVMSDAVERDLLSLAPGARFERHIHPLYSHFGQKMSREEARKNLNIPIDKKVLLFFGFIRGYKGLDVLLDALALLPEEYYVIVAGENYGSFDEYDKQIDRLNLRDRICLKVGYVPDADAALYFSAADVCALPYKSATQSGIVGISYQFDLPVIATDVGGLREMIEPYGSGLLAAKADPAVYAAAVKKYFDENLAAKLSENVANYKRLASWESLAKTIEKLYSTIKAR